MITGRQIRAARGLLGWDATDLASKAGLTRETVSKIENENVQARETTLNDIIRVFDDHAIEFIGDTGVQIKRYDVHAFEGKDANRRLLDDVHKTLRDTGGEVLIAGLDENMAITDVEKKFLEEHLARLSEAGIGERILIKAGDTNFVAPENTYRWVPEQYFSPYPLYIYGPKLALVSWAPIAKCIIIHDEAFAESTRRLFNYVWDLSEAPKKPKK